MKKEKRPTKAQRELAAAEEALIKRWGSAPKFARTAKPSAVKPLESVRSLLRENEPRHSLVTPGGSTALKPAAKYTGTAILGIATMHKSNAVPIFNSKAAIEVSAMRRG